MKQVYLFAIVSVLIGWSIGTLARPLEARRIAQVAVDQILGHRGSKDVKSLSENTIEVAENLRDQTTDKELPPEVIDARTKGQAAREKAIKDAIGKVFPKEDDWGVGGPLFPMAFTAKPRPRPETVALGPAPLPSPLPSYAVTGPWWGPGNPDTPCHCGHFGGGVNTPVPEPSTWVLMLAGFAALALRLRNRRPAAASR